MDAISIKSKFVRKTISKIVSAKVSESLGADVVIDIGELNGIFDEADFVANGQVTIKMNKEAIKKLFANYML